jgi:hypothetical protein
MVISMTNTIGWGTTVSAPEKAYVHASDCQKTNYLKVDCFDSCNGIQPGTVSKTKHHHKAHESLQVMDFHFIVALFNHEMHQIQVNTSYTLNPNTGAISNCFLNRLYPPPKYFLS